MANRENAKQQSKIYYSVEFLLSFVGEVSAISKPCHTNKEVVLSGDDFQNEQLQKELADVLKKNIAGLNELPEEMVCVEVVNFGRKES